MAAVAEYGVADCNGIGDGILYLSLASSALACVFIVPSLMETFRDILSRHFE